MAPEILLNPGYGKEVDYWAIGVILYIMLCGFPPFYEETNQELFEQIKLCKYEFPSPYWDDVSDMAKDLIKKLLCKDPKERLNADQILAHPWIAGESTPRTELANVTDKIKEFNAKRRLKKAGYLVMAATRMKKLAQMCK